MLSLNGTPGPGPGPSDIGIPPGGPHVIDVLLFIALVTLVLVLVDLASGWALSGLLHLGQGGVALMSVLVALPLGYAGYFLCRTALSRLGSRSGGDEAV